MKRSTRRNGSILVKMPVLIIAFLGFTGLAVDVGFIQLRRTTVQTAAEATAFSAAYKASAELYWTYGAQNLADVEAHAAPLAALNAPGCEAPVFEWGNWDRATGFHDEAGSGLCSALRVKVPIQQPRLFTALFLPNDPRVVGQATVVFTPYGDVWPLCISSTTPMTGGGILEFGPDSKNNAPGNKGWLAFNGDVNNIPMRIYLDGGPYTADIPSPWVTTLALDQMPVLRDLQTGTTGGGIDVGGTTGLKHTLEANVLAQITAGSVVLIPIWDAVEGVGSNVTYKIVGLVPIQLLTPYTDLDAMRARILTDGPIWFVPDEKPIETVRKQYKPSQQIVMVE
jgi:hypothetical protein